MRIVCALGTLSLISLALAGRLVPNSGGDAGSYLLAGSLHYPQFLFFTRSPFYGWFVHVVGWHELAFMPLIQVLIFFGAVVLLVRELARIGMSLECQIAIAVSCLFSSAFFKDANRILPEFCAISAGLFAFSGCLAVARGKRFGYAVVFFGAGAACLFHPIFLPIIFAVPLLTYYFADRRHGLRLATATFIVAAAPLLGYSTLRLTVAGEFNVVPYAGFQASPMATLMLDRSLANRLSGENRDLALAVLDEKKKQEREGAILEVPLNINGGRSFTTTALFYPDTMAAVYDHVLYIMSKQRRPDESYVSRDQRFMRYDLAIISLAPIRWLIWIVGQTGRLLGQAAITNYSMALAVVLATFAFFRAPLREGTDARPLLVVVILWLMSSGLLAVSASFAASRYIDTAGMLLPAIPAYWALQSFNLGRLEEFLFRVRLFPQNI